VPLATPYGPDNVNRMDATFRVSSETAYFVPSIRLRAARIRVSMAVVNSVSCPPSEWPLTHPGG